MIGSVGTPVQNRVSGKRGRIIHGEAGWIGINTTMVQYQDGQKEESDGDLVVVQDKAFVMCPCPTCKTPTPHSTVGMEKDERGVYQVMKCAQCGTSSHVYGGQAGEAFQENVEAPTGWE